MKRCARTLLFAALLALVGCCPCHRAVEKAVDGIFEWRGAVPAKKSGRRIMPLHAVEKNMGATGPEAGWL